MSKIKVVHYISTLRDGGAQTQVILLCSNIDLIKYDVTIVCWDKQTSIPINPEIPIIEIDRGKKKGVLKLASTIYKITKQLRPDIVHLWLPEVLTIPAAIAARSLGIPIINSERRIPTTGLSKLWFRDRSEYFIHLLADVVTTNFPIPIKRKSIFNALLNGLKGKTIYNGLDIHRLKSLRHDTDIVAGNSAFKLVYCGRLVRQKNVDILIRAIHHVIMDKYDVILDIYGAGEKETELKDLVSQYNLTDKIIFHGYKDNWKEFAVGADAFVLATSREGMPNVLFEAIAIGLPIITTTIEEITCHFTDGYDAILLEPGDHNGLATAIKKLIDTPLFLEQIKINAFKTVEKYSIEAMVRQYEELYESILFRNQSIKNEK